MGICRLRSRPQKVNGPSRVFGHAAVGFCFDDLIGGEVCGVVVGRW